jgi:serine/threonine protein kinase
MIVKQVLSGLKELHKYKLIHRDINPNNIYIKDTDSGAIAKIGDYGLVKSQRWHTSLSTGGTFPYMAPEMLEEGKERDYRCDIYSVGAVLYELLTWQRPPIGAVSEKPPEGLPLSDNLWQIIRVALSHLPEKRYQSVDEFLKALEKVQIYTPDTILISNQPTAVSATALKTPETNLLPSEEEPREFRGTVWTSELSKLYKYKKYDEVIRRLRKILENAEKTLGTSSPKLVPLLSSLAYVFSMKPEPASAEKIYYRSLDILRTFAGNESLQLIPILTAFATSYFRNKDFVNAEARYKEALTIKEKILGVDNPDLCNSIRYLAYLYRVTGKYQLSEFYYNRILTILEKAKVGKSHQEYLYALDGLRLLYRKWGKQQKVKEIETKINEIRKIT